MLPTGNLTTATDSPVTPTEDPVVLAEPDAGSTMLWSDNSYMVYVPAGEFEMGKNETNPSDHSPAPIVTLDGYWI